MDVNEEIVKEWLHLCKKQFTIDNISFKVSGSKGGSNYSNIDILAVDTEGNYYDYEVKWRSTNSIGATKKETVEGFLEQLFRKERVVTIKSIIGNKEYHKVFITTHLLLPKSKEKQENFINAFNNRDVKILFFEDIISELINTIKVKGRYDSPVIQTIRILKLFNMIIE